MTDEYRELLLGCGFDRTKKLGNPNDPLTFRNVTTVDTDHKTKCDWLCDLDESSWYFYPRDGGTPLATVHLTSAFDEIHAYNVLEYLGRQGDAVSFFGTFWQIYMLLKPGGRLFGITPSRHSPYLWGDPGNRRVIIGETLAFLDRTAYVGEKASYRHLFYGDFKVVFSQDNYVNHIFCLEAVKPARV